MEREKVLISLSAVLILVGTGLVLQSIGNNKLFEAQDRFDSQKTPYNNSLAEGNKSLKLGSAHKHALFFMNINGKDLDFTKEKYQLRSSYVHMENHRPHIVHKHSANVTWEFFLESMDIEVNTEKNCITVSGDENCGNFTIVLEGEEIENLDKEIEQGDNLAIVMPKDRNLTQEYMEEQLPKGYDDQLGHEI